MRDAGLGQRPITVTEGRANPYERDTTRSTGSIINYVIIIIIINGILIYFIIVINGTLTDITRHQSFHPFQ